MERRYWTVKPLSVLQKRQNNRTNQSPPVEPVVTDRPSRNFSDLAQRARISRPIRVALMRNKRIYRNIEILENQTLADLHEMIFYAFDKYDEHLYSFFLTRKPTRSMRTIYDSPGYTHPITLQQGSGFEFKKQYNAAESNIGNLGLKEEKCIVLPF